MKQRFVLQPSPHPARRNAMQAVQDAPAGYEVLVKEPTRNADQSAKFHAICGDLARSGMPWAGKRRTGGEWKVLLVSGHAVATKLETEFVPGLEGEFLNIRESTALMSVRRSSSLIEYTIAFCVTNEVPLSEPDSCPA